MAAGTIKEMDQRTFSTQAISAAELLLHIWNSTDFCDDRSDEVYVLCSSFNEQTILVEKVLFYRLGLEILMRKVKCQIFRGKARPGAYTSLFIISYHLSRSRTQNK
jgi:hypothetical protein